MNHSGYALTIGFWRKWSCRIAPSALTGCRALFRIQPISELRDAPCPDHKTGIQHGTHRSANGHKRSFPILRHHHPRRVHRRHEWQIQVTHCARCQSDRAQFAGLYLPSPCPASRGEFRGIYNLRPKFDRDPDLHGNCMKWSPSAHPLTWRDGLPREISPSEVSRWRRSRGGVCCDTIAPSSIKRRNHTRPQRRAATGGRNENKLHSSTRFTAGRDGPDPGRCRRHDA